MNIWADDVPAIAAWYEKFLDIEPFFEQQGPDGTPVYVEFRIGDYQAELGIVDRRFAPEGAAVQAAGSIMYWHVDDLEGAVARLLALGASEHAPVTPRGDAGVVTASVVDPAGNIIGLMTNPHYLEILGAGSAGGAGGTGSDRP